MEDVVITWITEQAVPTAVALLWALLEHLRNRRLLRAILTDEYHVERSKYSNGDANQ
jgi:hypothetical protein